MAAVLVLVGGRGREAETGGIATGVTIDVMSETIIINSSTAAVVRPRQLPLPAQHRPARTVLASRPPAASSAQAANEVLRAIRKRRQQPMPAMMMEVMVLALRPRSCSSRSQPLLQLSTLRWPPSPPATAPRSPQHLHRHRRYPLLLPSLVSRWALSLG